jgi:hypothetical protein
VFSTSLTMYEHTPLRPGVHIPMIQNRSHKSCTEFEGCSSPLLISNLSSYFGDKTLQYSGSLYKALTSTCFSFPHSAAIPWRSASEHNSTAEQYLILTHQGYEHWTTKYCSKRGKVENEFSLYIWRT